MGSTCPFEFLCLRIANDTCVLVDWRRGKLWLADVTTRDSAGESRKTPPFLNATPPKCHLLYYLTTAAPTLTELLSLDQVASNKNHLTQKSDRNYSRRAILPCCLLHLAQQHNSHATMVSVSAWTTGKPILV